MPLDPLVQRKSQFITFLAPAPLGGEFGYDRIGSVLRLVLLEHDEIVEYAHRRPVYRGRRLLKHRHARGTVEMADFENAALLLRRCGPNRQQKRARGREHAEIALHRHLPPVRGAGRMDPRSPPAGPSGLTYWR